MAVWLQIIGKRKFISIEDERRKIHEILSNVDLDLSFLEPTKFNSIYNSKNWMLKKDSNTEFYEYSLVEDIDVRYRSIRVIFNNPNFIEFSGPFYFFSEWFYLGEKFPETISEGWRKVFSTIAKQFQVNELLYFSEWFFATELVHSGEETAEDLFDRFSKFEAKEKESLVGLDHNDYFRDAIK